MVNNVRDFQRSFTRDVHSIRDEWTMFELNFADFRRAIMTVIPKGHVEMKTLRVWNYLL